MRMATAFQRWPFLFKPGRVRWFHPDVSRETPAVPILFYSLNCQHNNASIRCPIGAAP